MNSKIISIIKNPLNQSGIFLNEVQTYGANSDISLLAEFNPHTKIFGVGVKFRRISYVALRDPCLHDRQA